MEQRDRIYINGSWVEPQSQTTFDVIDATREEVMARIRGSSAADVDRAVAAARAAFEPWSARPVSERAAFLDKIQAGLSARAEEIARVVSQEVGTPLSARAPLAVRVADLHHRQRGEDRARVRVRRADRQLAGRARAGRRGRLHHAVELPAAADGAEGRAGDRGGLHGRAQAVRGRAARARTSWPR